MSARNIIGKLSYSNSNVHKLKSGTGFTPQSFALVSSEEMYVFCSGTNPNHVLKINGSGSYIDLGKRADYGHANGATYCHKNGLFYVTAYNYQSSTRAQSVYAVNPNSFKIEFRINLDMSCSGIAYDRITENFYISNTSKIGVYNFSDFSKAGSAKHLRYITKQFQDGRAHQDICGFNGIIMSVMSIKDNTSATAYIDLYDSKTKGYKGSWEFKKGELESIDIDQNGIIHAIKAGERRYIKTSTKFNINVSSSDIFAPADYVSEEQYSSAVLSSNANKLYRSDNFEYLEEQVNENNQTKDLIVDSIKKSLESISNSNYGGIPDTPQIVFALTQNTSGEFDNTKRRQTKLEGEVFGPSLPTALDPVEAPFAEITIGGFAFGIYEGDGRYDKYPNYIDSINVRKTNGSMNEYTINLIHQVRPGSNPNFIDELLSKNGYNKIIIRYGDANSGVEFIDSNALLVGVNVSFDFINCNIKYTLKATSSAVSIASHKRTFSSIEDKPSNIIRDLLYNDANEDLLTAFPRMRDKNFVEKNNLIPNNDSVVEVDEFKNINAVSYLSSLVSIMKSNVDDIVNSNYMLTINDGYFKINEISNNYSYDASLYEVNINFPDDNQVFDFSIDTDYSWPIAYEYSGDVSNYNYDINNIGNSVTYTTNSSHLLDFSSPSQDSLNNNWWKQVTEFPVSAKLTCRGLLSPQLLLTYIKINCIYFGSERIISGVYIVTGQEDSLSGSGYKTTLSLLRVASSKQHIIVDGRVKT